MVSGKTMGFVLTPEPMVNPWFIKLIQRWAFDDKASGKLIYFEPGDARFQFRDDSQLVLKGIEPGAEAAAVEFLEWLGKAGGRGIVHVVLLGGEPGLREALAVLELNSTRGARFYVYHLREDGDLWTGPRTEISSDVGKALEEVRTSGETSLPDPRVFHKSVGEHLGEAKRNQQELKSFQERLQGRVPWVTYTFLAALGVVFALEWYFGGISRMDVLARMGANVGVRVREGEWWRLLSSVFLHMGTMHMVCNGYVLYALGSFVEQLIGGARVAVILVLSGLCGSVASVWMDGAAMSVGASGALWGMFGAAGALAFRPKGVIPAFLVPRLKKSIVVNLGINLLVSFLPGIDIAAHLGGGLAGALLLGTGVLGRREEGASGPSARERGTGAVAVALALVAVLSLGMAISTGRPWLLTGDWSWRSVSVGDSELVVELPDIFSSEKETFAGGRVHYLYGDALFDPVIVSVVPMPKEMTPALFERQMPALLGSRGESDLPKGAVWEVPPRSLRPKEVPGKVGIYDRFRLRSGAVVHSLILMGSRRGVTLEWVARDGTERHFRGLRRVGRSLDDL